MTLIDYSVISIFALIVISIAFFFRGSPTKESYLIGNRSFSWVELSFSHLTTQLSAIVLLTISSLIGYGKIDGFTYLQAEVIFPIVIFIIISWVIPVFYRLKIISVYEYLELRFGYLTRIIGALFFIMAKGLSVSVIVYYLCLSFEAVFEISYLVSLLSIAITVGTIIIVGGYRALIWINGIFLILLLIGFLNLFFVSISILGGVSDSLSELFTYYTNKGNYVTQVITQNEGMGMGANSIFPGGLIFFLFLYGFDQSQFQRVLAAETEDKAKKSYYVLAFLRFPIMLLLVIISIFIGIIFIESTYENGGYLNEQISLIPKFILDSFPFQMKGLMICFIWAASLGPISSNIHSIMTVTIEDLIVKFIRSEKFDLRFTSEKESQKDIQNEENAIIRLSHLFSLFWLSFFITIAAIYLFNQELLLNNFIFYISILFGLITSLFVLGLVFKFTQSIGVIIGIISSLAILLFLFFVINVEISWINWTSLAFILSTVIGIIVSYLYQEISGKTKQKNNHLVLKWSSFKSNKKYFGYIVLYSFFIFILIIGIKLFY